MSITYPNQKVIHINRDMPKKEEGNFLLIKKENWYAANKDLEPYGLQLYLYLAGNKDGFDLALSQAAAEEDAGIKKTTFHTHINRMIEKGYLVNRQGNIYDFYERPQNKTEERALPAPEQENPSDKFSNPQEKPTASQDNKEIYNNTHSPKNNDIYNDFIF